jgi:hypothetical protein
MFLSAFFFLVAKICQNAKKKVAGESPLTKNWTKKICCHILTLPGKQ